jgi:hypothetical protein
MFSVSPIEPIVSLDDASVSQIDYQCASAEVCVIEDVVSAQDVAQLTTGNVGATIDGLTSILKDVAQEPSNPDAVSLNGLPSTNNEDVAFNGENIAYMAGTPIEQMGSLDVADRDAMFGTLGATETWIEQSSLIDTFDSLVDRFSNSANYDEKLSVAKSMMLLINDHTYTFGNDEFKSHVDEFFESDAVQNGGIQMEIQAYLKIDMFDSLVHRFSSSADLNDKIAAVESMRSLVTQHFPSFETYDKFTSHVIEFFEREALQHNEGKSELLRFIEVMEAGYDAN